MGKSLKEVKVPNVKSRLYSYCQVPIQPNFFDCGVFTLHFIDIICRNLDYFQDGLRNLDFDSEKSIDWEMEKIDGMRVRLRKDIEEAIVFP
jgi:Ulp1 family protease